jgi:hypothetical protein
VIDPGTDVMILKSIFAEKFGENNGVFCSNNCYFLQKYDNNIVFLRKVPFFSPKIFKNRRKLRTSTVGKIWLCLEFTYYT